MIDKKKIREAAKNFCESHEDERKAIQQAELDKGANFAYTFIRPEVAFKAGINWFLDNLWHDASEEPKEGKTALVKAKVTYLNDSKGIEYIVALSVKDGKSIDWLSISAPDGCVCYEKISYVYIEDLLKGGKIWKK